MGEIKTKVNNDDVSEFLNSVPDERKRADSFALLEIFKTATNEPPKMWGSSIVGFGMYHYKSERSTQEGDWPLTGFSPRKHNLTVYIMDGFSAYGELLKRLGKHKTSVSCLYINKLQDVDRKILQTIIKKSYNTMNAQHPKA